MRNKKIVISIILSLVLIICVICTFLVVSNINKNKIFDYVQELDYVETIEDVLNPDQGFYRTAEIKVTPTSVEDKSYVISESFQVYHLRMDISAFSYANNGVADFELTENCLLGIKDILTTFYNAEKNVVVRYSYDNGFSGNINAEPSETMILKHIEQLADVLNLFPLTITAIEAGMVGPWGEMHTSDLANSITISKIIDKFLAEINEIPILVRTPKMIYDYLGIAVDEIGGYTIQKNSKAYRLGLFNDGYLGSETDLGTYTNRALEIDWISKQTNHLPFGGEVTRPSSTFHDIQNCLVEMDKINLSYLNYEWNDEIVQDKWQKQVYDNSCGFEYLYYGKTAYEFIRNHMGYRFVLNNSIFSYSNKFDNLKVCLKLSNIGFGNLNRVKDLQVYFVQDDNIKKVVNIGDFTGQERIDFEVEISDLNNKFKVYLGINSKGLNGEQCYALRFANNLWNFDLKANLIGEIDISR